MVLSQEPQNFNAKQLAAMEQEAAARFEDILEQANIPANNSAEQDMIVSSYHLVDDREECIAPIYTGYPSVDAKPRDTFIALPGLLLATGREDVALKTLKYWLGAAEKNGWVMPERVSGCGCAFENGGATTDSGLSTRPASISATSRKPVPKRTRLRAA